MRIWVLAIVIVLPSAAHCASTSVDTVGVFGDWQVVTVTDSFSDAIVLVYLSNDALSDQSGERLLIRYEGDGEYIAWLSVLDRMWIHASNSTLEMRLKEWNEKVGYIRANSSTLAIEYRIDDGATVSVSDFGLPSMNMAFGYAIFGEDATGLIQECTTGKRLRLRWKVGTLPYSDTSEYSLEGFRAGYEAFSAVIAK